MGVLNVQGCNYILLILYFTNIKLIKYNEVLYMWNR